MPEKENWFNCSWDKDKKEGCTELPEIQVQHSLLIKEKAKYGGIEYKVLMEHVKLQLCDSHQVFQRFQKSNVIGFTSTKPIKATTTTTTTTVPNLQIKEA